MAEDSGRIEANKAQGTAPSAMDVHVCNGGLQFSEDTQPGGKPRMKDAHEMSESKSRVLESGCVAVKPEISILRFSGLRLRRSGSHGGEIT